MANTVFTLNPYFNNYGYANTQNLLDDLVCESISRHGILINYLPRDIENFNDMFSEGSQYKFTDYFPMPAYQEGYQNFGGAGSELMSKFGIFLQNTSTFYIARKHFEQTLEGVLNIPREGDIIYVGEPWKNLMIITHVSHTDGGQGYFPHGKFQTYELQTELFTYSGEDFEDCGNEEIITELESYPVGNTAYAEPSDNEYLANNGGVIIDTTETNPYNF